MKSETEAEPYVWVQIFVKGGEDDDGGEPFQIWLSEIKSGNIAGLKDRIIPGNTKDAAKLKVYGPGTTWPIPKGAESRRPNEKLSKFSVTDKEEEAREEANGTEEKTGKAFFDTPLIVVEPEKVEGERGPEKTELSLVPILDLVNVVDDGSGSCVRSGWRQERGNTLWPKKLYLRPHLLQVKERVKNFIESKTKTRLYVEGPPGCGKTTFFLLHFAEYAASNSKKGLLVQYRQSEVNEIIVIDGSKKTIYSVRVGHEQERIDASKLLERLRSFIKIYPAKTFDFVIFDGVRQALDQCQAILGYINTHFDKMNIHITSLEFDIKSGDGSAGSDGPNQYLRMESWTYEDYKAAYNDKGFQSKQQWLSLLGTVAEIQENATSGNEFDANQFAGAGDPADDFMDTGDSNSSMDTGDSSDETADAWLESLMERKFYYAGGSARLMFDFNLNDLVEEELDRLEGKAGHYVWRELAKLQINIKSGGVSSLLQRLDGKVFPVSKYFLYKAYRACRDEIASSLKTAADAANNPAMKGWAFELEQLEIVAAEMESSNSVTDSVTSPTLVVPISNTWAEYDGIQVQGKPPSDVFSIRCTKWNQGCFDLAFYFQGHLLTVNFTISTSHSLKVQYLRWLKHALEVAHKTVNKMTHIAVVPDRDTRKSFTFDKPEGNGYEQGTRLFTIQVGCSSKLVAPEARNLGALPDSTSSHNHSVDAEPKLEMKKLDDVGVFEARKSGRKRVKLQDNAFLYS